MYSIREAVEQFIRLMKADISEDAVLVPPDDIFEAQRVPNLLIQGPTLKENKSRRTMAREIVKDVDSLTYDDRPYPRFYHLDFDLILTTTSDRELIDLSQKAVRFFSYHRELVIESDEPSLNLTELVAMGELKRVNLTNLRQMSGKYRIEDCPVYSDELIVGPLVTSIDLDFDTE